MVKQNLHSEAQIYDHKTGMNDTEAETVLSLALFYIHGCKSESSSNHNGQDNTVHSKVVCSFVEVSGPVLSLFTIQ